MNHTAFGRCVDSRCKVDGGGASVQEQALFKPGGLARSVVVE